MTRPGYIIYIEPRDYLSNDTIPFLQAHPLWTPASSLRSLLPTNRNRRYYSASCPVPRRVSSHGLGQAISQATGQEVSNLATSRREENS